MKFLIILVSSVLIVQGTPLKPPMGPAADKLESFPWMKAPKGKAKFITTPAPASPQTEVAKSPASGPAQPVAPPPNPPFALTNQMLQDYISSLTASLQPFVVPDPPSADTALAATQPPFKRPLKGKVPKQVDPSQVPATTDTYWDAERKLYPDSFYDEFYLDWLRKRQVEEEQAVATPNPAEVEPMQQAQPAAPADTPVTAPTTAPAAPPSQPLPAVPLAFNPYLISPYMYPLAGMKVSKVMAQAQVNAALAAMNITTTSKPIKIKLKIPIPAGSDMAQVVSAGIAGFPPGTTYDLSKK